MKTTHFKGYSKADLMSLTRLRRYETKAGERIALLRDPADPVGSLQSLEARFVILGVPEDIGVQANGGIAGTSTAWLAFLQSFLNIQSNDFFAGEEAAVIGHFDFGDIQFLIDKNASGPEEKLEAYRHAVQTIDDEVEALIKAIVAAGKVPIVIGGGHNNAYPLIKGTAKGLHAAGRIPLARLNCVNLDAHTDYRPAEGRHSGNPFRYAEDDGYLQKYCAVGIHENSLQQNVWIDMVNNPFMDAITFEDIFLHEKRSFRQAVMHALSFTDDGFRGIELDLDSIEGVLSSATTPCGVMAREARQYVALCAASGGAAYLHLCEGASRLSTGRTADGTGRLLAYLVTDFIKGHQP